MGFLDLGQNRGVCWRGWRNDKLSVKQAGQEQQLNVT